jgi:NADH-quinone oxidoreductase subunit I
MSDSNDRKNVVSSEAPWVDGTGIVVRVAKGLKSLMTGMRITGNYFVHPSTVVTQQYPDNRATLQLPSRFRAHLAFNTDTDGYNACTVCRICEDACPNRSIIITQREKPAVIKKELDAFVWRMDTCTFCNACVMSCPVDVLRFDGKFESSVYDRRLLQFTLNDYAGPTGNLLRKIEDPEARKAATEPRDLYSGPTILQQLIDKKKAEKAARKAAAEAVAAQAAPAAAAPVAADSPEV